MAQTKAHRKGCNFKNSEMNNLKFEFLVLKKITCVKALTVSAVKRIFLSYWVNVIAFAVGFSSIIAAHS